MENSFCRVCFVSYLKFVRFSRGDNCHQTATEQPFRNFRIFIVTAKYLFHTLNRVDCKQSKTKLTNHSQWSEKEREKNVVRKILSIKKTLNKEWINFEKEFYQIQRKHFEIKSKGS